MTIFDELDDSIGSATVPTRLGQKNFSSLESDEANQQLDPSECRVPSLIEELFDDAVDPFAEVKDEPEDFLFDPAEAT